MSTDATEIGELAQNYFSNLFTASPYYMQNRLFGGIHPRITKEEDEIFSAGPSPEEVKEVIKGMNPASSPENDGFNGYFHSACWEII